MPPKTAPAVDGAADPMTANITALCHLMLHAEDFKVNSAAMAPILGISAAKNVPRKINSIINPYGFELKAGKIVLMGQSGQAATNGDDGEAPVPVTPAPKAKAKGPKTPKTPKTPASKKRKLDTSAIDADDADDAADAPKVETPVKSESLE